MWSVRGARAISLPLLVVASAAPAACAFWDMGDWADGHGTLLEGGAAEASSDARSETSGSPFCATQAGSIFCADFDEDPSVSYGWYGHQADNGTSMEPDPVFFRSPPRSVVFALDPSAGGCAYDYLGQHVSGSVQSATLAFDIRAGEADGGRLSTASAPTTRERFCAGPACSSCSNDHCPQTAVCYYILGVAAGETIVDEQVVPADGGPDFDVSHSFVGAKLEPGVWARARIAVDLSSSPGTLTVTLATDGGAPVTVVHGNTDPACSGAALTSVMVGFTCASSAGGSSVRFDDIVVSSP